MGLFNKLKFFSKKTDETREEVIDMEKDKKKGKKKRKFNWKMLGIFLAFEFVFTLITAPFVLLYGPFELAKKTYVEAAMTTMTKQWLATAFLPQEKIDEILKSNDEKVEEPNKDIEEVEVKLPVKTDDTLEFYTLENPKYKGYALIISDPRRIEIAYTNQLLKEGQTTSEMARDWGAVAAINGGAFNDVSSTSSHAGNGGTPSGVIISNGQIVFNEMDKKSKTEVFAMTREGKMLAGFYTVDELIEQDVTQAVSFWPTLIRNGKALPLSNDGGLAQRTAIGQRADGSIVMLVIDGRSISSLGASLTEVQGILLNKFNCVTAINLDGGKSSTMYLNGKIKNNLGSNVGERSIPSAIIVK